MKLRKGQIVPSFKSMDIQNQAVDLDQFKGQKVMVSFYRYAECMFCNLRVHQLSQLNSTFQTKGLKIIAFFQSPKEDILKSMEKIQPPFQIISDEKRSIYKQYGVLEASAIGFLKGSLKLGKAFKAMKNGFHIKPGKGSLTLIPADFLINEDQTIHQAFYGNDISDHIPIKDIHAFLDEL